MSRYIESREVEGNPDSKMQTQSRTLTTKKKTMMFETVGL